MPWGFQGVFEKMDPPEEYKMYRISPWRGKELVRTLYIYKGYGFKGGIRWQPPNKEDIRATKLQVAQ